MSSLKTDLKRTLADYLRRTGLKVVPEKKWEAVFTAAKSSLPADSVARVVESKGQQFMVVMTWDPLLSDVLVHFVTSDGSTHRVPG